MGFTLDAAAIRRQVFAGLTDHSFVMQAQVQVHGHRLHFYFVFSKFLFDQLRDFARVAGIGVVKQPYRCHMMISA